MTTLVNEGQPEQLPVPAPDVSCKEFLDRLDECMKAETKAKSGLRFRLKPLIEDIADQILNHRDDPRLIWESHYRVFVRVKKILPKDATPGRLRKSRQKRFRTLLRERLKREGWASGGKDVYVYTK